MPDVVLCDTWAVHEGFEGSFIGSFVDRKLALGAFEITFGLLESVLIVSCRVLDLELPDSRSPQ